jgi:hypothetical protein
MALGFIQRAQGPILVGKLALHLGWWISVEETEALVLDLVREGYLRLLTPEEASAFGVRHGYTRAPS